MNKSTKSAKLIIEAQMGKESEFFKGKRPWSRIKDQILTNYLTPYISKVAKLNKRIVIVDAFAGPGRFDDGSIGSPLIICETAERIAPDKYFAIFLNSDKDSYENLNTNIKNYIDNNSAKSIYGQAEDLLSILRNIIGDSTLLLYLDPFGLKGCDFHLLEPYLGRDKKFSTEIFINMSMPTLHRYATRIAVKSGKVTSQTKSLNLELSKILGSEDWKDIMWSEIPAEEKEEKVVEQYVNRLRNYLPFAGCCPVREKISSRTKYYIIFCSRHPDALVLMNDFMHNAYFGILSEVSFKDTLFEDQAIDLIKPSGNLEEEIINTVNKYPGIMRKDCWLEIIKNHFMVWTKSEFIKMVDQLGKEEELKFQSRTKRLNENAQLYPKDYNQNPNPSPVKMKIHWDYFLNLNNKPELLLKKMNDGSIITRFDKTPLPKESHDVVCPHFVELKWAYGCPFDCSWCYLKGTFRFKPDGLAPVFKDIDKIKNHVQTFLDNIKTPELFNTGEIADSLMGEHLNPPFSKFIIQLFEEQNTHKVLFVTKSTNINNILAMPSAKQAVFSFSLNAMAVADMWEKRAPSPLKRLEAAKKLHDRGYTVRARIDPIVPVKDWEKHYRDLIDKIFARFVPERITLGSLRGLQSTINGTNDKSWTGFLKEYSNWGKKVDFTLRSEIYSYLIDYLEDKYSYQDVALCKESIEVWEKLGMDWKNIRCNCLL